MNRQQQLLGLAARLKTAAEAKDWQALHLADRELASTLPRLAAAAAWTAAERSGLLALRAAHSEAYQHCALESLRLHKHLNDMQANMEGWIAYALNGENDLNGSKQ
ncbi:hypothetical protein [Undibacterium terreum]|uniref:Flagellar protein FliT n=1 Tax=Undibacterium terreum TaxID=1224302 RepID=A0A916XHX9_9BURK|nr:hypothetical protein [Undibacterium terreum]GGC74522.1 hypothetical protein GCM10011396_22200 [Undibacterium terreum]